MTNRFTLSREAYAALRVEVVERDGFRCKNPLCKRPNSLEVDHMVPRSQGGPDAIENLITLCRTCHELKGRGDLLVIPDPVVVARFFDLRRRVRCEDCQRAVEAGSRVYVPTPNGGVRCLTVAS